MIERTVANCELIRRRQMIGPSTELPVTSEFSAKNTVYACKLSLLKVSETLGGGQAMLSAPAQYLLAISQKFSIATPRPELLGGNGDGTQQEQARL